MKHFFVGLNQGFITHLQSNEWTLNKGSFPEDAVCWIVIYHTINKLDANSLFPILVMTVGEEIGLHFCPNLYPSG